MPALLHLQASCYVGLLFFLTFETKIDLAGFRQITFKRLDPIGLILKGNDFNCELT